ncbi:MAG: TRAP transporter small permease subunit [Betaproteobacteria bacterium]|nr:MAG: TRAP transporter small permease subunit [Betaproteobacteria bacterium]
MIFLERLGALVNRALAWIAGIALVAMMLFAVADMVLRALGRPVAGSYEVIGWLSASAMALALGYTQLHRGHVSITLLKDHLGARTQATIDLLMSLLALLLFGTVAWYVARYARTLQTTGSLSETLKAIVYPWVYVVAAGSAGLALALLIDVLRSAGRFLAVKRGRG